MRHPFEKISIKIINVILPIVFGITLLIGWQLTQIGYPEVTLDEIISLEFAGTPEIAREIVKSWSKGQALNKAIHYQWIDFLFMIAYSTTLSLACIWSTHLSPSFNSKWIKTGIILAWGQWFAAGFDAIENIALFPFLYGTARDEIPLAQVAAISAGLKFILIVLGVLYVLISVGLKAFRSVK